MHVLLRWGGCNVIVLFQTLLCAGNCVKLFDLFVNRIQVEFCYLAIRRLAEQALKIKLLWRSWWEKIRLKENSIVLCWNCMRKTYFRYDGGCGQVSYAEISGECRAQLHGLRGFTGVANKIG